MNPERIRRWLWVVFFMVFMTPTRAFGDETDFVFDVVTGNAGVLGVASQGPSGPEMTFTLDAETGLAQFGTYEHVTFLASVFPDPVTPCNSVVP